MLRTASLAALSLLVIPALAQSGGIALPVTFEESIDYEIVGFAGAEQSEIVADPADPDNNVVRVIRAAGAETFAGTVVANNGLEDPIPFTPDATTMSVRVWTPVAGTPVVLKVEQAGNGAVAVESQPVLSTVGGMYETLEFDFAAPAVGSLDFSATYDKLVVFFDFGRPKGDAVETTYYFDDIAFGSDSGGGGALVINEVDADTPGDDTAEFIEIYNPGSAAVTLDGYVVVFFNGSNDASYRAFDLTGTLAAGAYYVLGNPGVPNANQTFEPGSFGTLQNGADAVALYTGAASDFPSGTAASSTNLVDAIVYDTDDSDDAGLLAALNQTIQYDEAENGNKDNESIQRVPDGASTIVTAVATPGAANAANPEPDMLTALLRGENEVPPVETDAKGGVTVVLDGTTLTLTGSFAGLESDFTGAHIHGGSDTENKPVVVALDATLTDDNRGGTFEAAKNTYTVRTTFADSIRAGLAYVNVHSTGNPGGEIRGQLGTSIQTLPFALSGANEVPPVTTDATGSGTVSLDGSTVTVTGSFSSLMGDYAASHIHGGAADENGGVVVALAPVVDADRRGGAFEAATNTFEVRTTFADSIRAGLAYVNVHSATFPTGEIRGQIGTPAPLVVVTIAEARAAGVGATVTIEGTVTRSMGAFTYLQDGTAGLTIRQAGDFAFADSVASGAIASGTTLRVTGTLSEFRQLLQINGDSRGQNLDSFEITGTADVPEPQTVTLAQLAANGEDYEGELVTVEAVTIDNGGDTLFDEGETNGETYQITDASDATNAVTLRIPNADDTSADGTPIPPRATITGIAGQFDPDTDNADDFEGYQILVIDVADIEALPAVANEDGASDELTLVVANPIRSGATVRFTLDAPGAARVALYDALGRQVAVLADGEMTAGVQTARLDAGALATGVYVLRLEAETGAVSQTVTVVR